MGVQVPPPTPDDQGICPGHWLFRAGPKHWNRPLVRDLSAQQIFRQAPLVWTPHLGRAGWQRGGIDDPLTVGSRLQPSVPLNRPEGEPWLTVCRVKPRCVVKSQRCNSLAVMPCLVQQARRAFSGEIPSDSNSLMALVDAQTARWSTIPNMLAHQGALHERSART